MSLKTTGTLDDRLKKVTDGGRSLKAASNDLKNKITSGNPVSAANILAYGNTLKKAIDQIDVALADTALPQNAIDAFGDDTYVIGTELNALKTAVQAAISEFSAIPQSGGYYQVVIPGDNASSEYRTFTQAQLTDLATAIDGIVAAIE